MTHDWDIFGPEETPKPASEWNSLVVSSDGTPDGTRVYWHGDDITQLVKIQFLDPPPSTIPAPAETVEPAICEVCSGDGWGKSVHGKPIPCLGCYGMGKTWK
jgi:hypothetical protein